jgi:hypothetical protein
MRDSCEGDMTSNAAVDPLDMEKLLAMLNAAEDGAPEDRSEAVLPSSELDPSADHHPQALTPTMVRAEPGGPVPDDIENRFAAHIVHGMAKLKAR